MQVYIGELSGEVPSCASRNVHKRSEEEVGALHRGWEATPSHFNKVDFSGFLQDKSIQQVEMEDATNQNSNPERAPADNDNEAEEDDEAVSFRKLEQVFNRRPLSPSARSDGSDDAPALMFWYITLISKKKFSFVLWILNFVFTFFLMKGAYNYLMDNN